MGIVWQWPLKLHPILTVHILMESKHAQIDEQQDFRKHANPSALSGINFSNSYFL